MTSFTLSYNGVDFCLTPAAGNEVDNGILDASAESLPSMSVLNNESGKGDVRVRLTNFSGILRVRPTSPVRATAEDQSLYSEYVNTSGPAAASPPPDLSQQSNTRHATPSPPPAKEEVSASETTKKDVKGKLKKRRTTSKTQVIKKPRRSSTTTVRRDSVSRTPTLGQSQEIDVDSLQPSILESLSVHAKAVIDENSLQCTAAKEGDQINSSGSQLSGKSGECEMDLDKKSSPNESTKAPFSSEQILTSVVELGGSQLSSEDEREEDSIEGEECRASSPTKGVEQSLWSLSSKKNTPCARWGHTLSLIDHRRLLVYGGQCLESDLDSGGEIFKTLSDIHLFDLESRKWSKPNNCDGLARCWHSTSFLPERNLLICFGGEANDPKTGKTCVTDQIMVLDTEIMLWYPPSVNGVSPAGRSGHSATLLPNSAEVVIFGGVRNSKWLNSLAVLDTNRWRWSQPKLIGNAPQPRSYHTATQVGNKIVIFGGNDGFKSFNSVHVIDATRSKWAWFHPHVSGTPPQARTGHTATLLDDCRTIVVYGGWDPNEGTGDQSMVFADTFLLDTETWSWSKGPIPRYLGGTGVPNGGAARVGHAAVLAPGGNGTHALVFSGRTQETFAEDFQTLSVLPSRSPSLRK